MAERTAPTETDESCNDACEAANFRRPNVIEVSSAAFDLDYAGVGSTYFPGDAAGTGLTIPRLSPGATKKLFAFRLCGYKVAPMQVARILGLRTLITIGTEPVVTVSGPTDSWTYPIEREVTSPLWKFPDGNVSFYLRVLRGGLTRRPWYTDPNQVIGTSPDIYGTSSAQIYVPVAWGAPTVTPGTILGDGVYSLGTWRDPARFPWGNISLSLNYEVEGPAVIGLFAFVHQTDPTTRPTPPSPISPLFGAHDAILAKALRPEDAFLLAYADAAYRRIAGSMTIDEGARMRLDRPVLKPIQRMIDRVAKAFK